MSENRRLPQVSDQQARLSRFCLDQAPFGFFRLDADGRFQYANTRACESLGYSLDELLNMSVFDIDPTVSPDTWADLWRRMCASGGVMLQATHRRKDGTTFPVEITASLLEFEGRQFAVSFVQDVTERKRVDEALHLSQFSFEKASIGIFRVGSKAQILNVNEQACRNLGYRPEELKNMTIMDIDPAISFEDWHDLWQKRCAESEITFETVHRRKDGTTFPVEITANYLEFEGQRFSITFVRDITAQKEDEKQKAIMEANLRQAQRLEALGALAGGIAHDFNNILSAIIGYAELAQLGCENNPKTQNYLSQLCVAGDRAKNLVQQILTFSRRGGSEIVPVDISRIVNEALGLIRATVPSTIEIVQNVQSNLGAVFADETKVHQIVMNFCTNAYQSMEKEGGVLEVALAPATISAHDASNYPDIKPGQYLKLIVSDTGHGMAPGTIARIFDPYFTTKEKGVGTGMGLSTVHGIVKDHGGSIKVYSEPGVGTTFQVFFPMADTAPDHSSLSVVDLPRGKERILYVDDEILLIEIGKELLQGLGYAVETRASAIDALEAFRIHPEKYHLVISDMTMPKMTGDQLAVEIKKIRPDIPIILSSGFSARIDSQRLARIGVSEMLMKPVTLYDLAKTVRRVLDESKNLT